MTQTKSPVSWDEEFLPSATDRDATYKNAVVVINATAASGVYFLNSAITV